MRDIILYSGKPYLEFTLYSTSSGKLVDEGCCYELEERPHSTPAHVICLDLGICGTLLP